MYAPLLLTVRVLFENHGLATMGKVFSSRTSASASIEDHTRQLRIILCPSYSDKSAALNEYFRISFYNIPCPVLVNPQPLPLSCLVNAFSKSVAPYNGRGLWSHDPMLAQRNHSCSMGTGGNYRFSRTLKAGLDLKVRSMDQMSCIGRPECGEPCGGS
jgi:hypothetical protein